MCILQLKLHNIYITKYVIITWYTIYTEHRTSYTIYTLYNKHSKIGIVKCLAYKIHSTICTPMSLFIH